MATNALPVFYWKNCRQVIVLFWRRSVAASMRKRIPSIMGATRNENCADFADGRLQINHRFAIDAVVNAEGSLAGIQLPVGIGSNEDRIALSIQLVGPRVGAADAMFIPALQCTTATRSLIIQTRPFVVSLGQLIKHARADRYEFLPCTAFHVPGPEQIIRDASQTESGAGALISLIEHQACRDVAGDISTNVLFKWKASGQRS